MQVGDEKSYSAESSRPYICPKCNSSFDQFDEFNKHIQGVCSNVEPEKKAYCIAFKGSDCVSTQKRINFTVNDYYYGYANGSSSYKKRVVSKKFSCYSCGKVLRNNLRFMSHVRHKIENEWKENDNVNDFNICNHCYRHYSSPFHLQCHIETVHATVPAATTCRICELNFENEQVFLMHMKDKHTYKEMPYICGLCSFRCSFYFDLTMHFRTAHDNCSSLLCPFCLAIHQTANSYLTHVIQHMNKSVRCTQCRLQFFTLKDKTQHVQTDHKSVFNCVGKKVLPKNPNQYMIFVKVSHHPLSPTKSQPPAKSQPPPQKKIPVVTSKNVNEILKSVPAGWSFTNQYDSDIPMDYRPFCRQSKIFVVLHFEALKQTVTNCIECGENLGVFVANYNKHFNQEFRCRKCSFLTRCFQAIKKHILEYHLKKKYIPRKANSAGVLNTPSMLPSTADKHSGNKNDEKSAVSSKSNRSTKKSSQQSPNLSPTPKKNSVSSDQKSISDMSDASDVSPVQASVSTEQPDLKDSTSLNSKSAAKKRKITDINSLLMMKEQEQENEKASKQRRKQLKPQKVDLSDEENGEQSSSLPGKDILSKPVEPPPLDNSFPVDFADELEEDNNSGGRDSPVPKLKVKFASHLGLSKKKSPGSSSLKPFVNPRSSAKNLPPMPNLVTPSLPTLTKKFPTLKAPTISKQPVSRKTARKSTPSMPVQPRHPTVKLPFPTKKMEPSLMNKTPGLSDLLTPPNSLAFSDVTNSSFLVSWKAPANTNVTEFKLVFQGAGLPTTQRLPVEQTSVRLIGLRSNTLYLVQLCAVYRVLQSSNIEGIQRTRGLREHKQKAQQKVDEVIILDDDEEKDVMPVASSRFPNAVRSSKKLLQVLPPKQCLPDGKTNSPNATALLRSHQRSETLFNKSQTLFKNTALTASKTNLGKPNMKVPPQTTHLEKLLQTTSANRSAPKSRPQSISSTSLLPSNLSNTTSHPQTSLSTSKPQITSSCHSETSPSPQTVSAPHSEIKRSLSVLPKPANNSILVVPDRSVRVTVVSAKAGQSNEKDLPVKESDNAAKPSESVHKVDKPVSNPKPTPSTHEKISDETLTDKSVTISTLNSRVGSDEVTKSKSLKSNVLGIDVDDKNDFASKTNQSEKKNEQNNQKSSSYNGSRSEKSAVSSNKDSSEVINESNSIEVEVDVHQPSIISRNGSEKDADEVGTLTETIRAEPRLGKRKADVTKYGVEKALKTDVNGDILEVIQENRVEKKTSVLTSNGIHEHEISEKNSKEKNALGGTNVSEDPISKSPIKPNINGITISAKPVASVRSSLSKPISANEIDAEKFNSISTQNCRKETPTYNSDSTLLDPILKEKLRVRSDVNAAVSADKTEEVDTEKQTLSIQDLDNILSLLDDD